MHLPVEASSGQRVVLYQISLTFHEPLGHADLLSDVSPL